MHLSAKIQKWLMERWSVERWSVQQLPQPSSLGSRLTIVADKMSHRCRPDEHVCKSDGDF